MNKKILIALSFVAIALLSGCAEETTTIDYKEICKDKGYTSLIYSAGKFLTSDYGVFCQRIEYNIDGPFIKTHYISPNSAENYINTHRSIEI